MDNTQGVKKLSGSLLPEDSNNSKEGGVQGQGTESGGYSDLSTVKALRGNAAADIDQGSLRNSAANFGNPSSNIETGVTPLRWYILAVYMLTTFATMVQYSYVTIVPQMSEYYDVSAADINFCAAIYSIMFAVGAFPGCKVVEKLGLRGSVLLGAVLILIGSIIKLFSAIADGNFPLLILGNIVASSTQCLLLGCPPLVASVWFPEDERTLATAIGSVAGHIAFAVNVLASPLILHSEPSGDLKGGIIRVFIFQVGVCALSLLLMVTFKKAPELPPSITASTGQASDIHFLPSLKRCFSKPNFLLILICMLTAVGLYTTFITMMAQLLEPFGIGEDKIGVMGFTCEFAGIFATIGVGKIVDKIGGYRKPWMALLAGQGVSFLMITLGSHVVAPYSDTGYYVLVFIFFFLTEVNIFPQYAVAMELAVETTYPEPAMIGGSAVIIGVAIGNTVGNLAFSYYVGDKPTRDQTTAIFWFLIIISVVCLTVVFFFLEDDLARKKIQNAAGGEPRADSSLLPSGGSGAEEVSMDSFKDKNSEEALEK